MSAADSRSLDGAGATPPLLRAALIALVLSISGVAIAYASGFRAGGAPAWAPWLQALGIAGAFVSTMTLGAARNGRIGVLAIPFAFVFLVIAGGFAIVLALPPADPADPELWLGLPPRAAVVLYGIGLLPMLALPLAYALTFDHLTLSEEDLARIRREARALASAAGVRPPLDAPPPAADPAASARAVGGERR